MMRLVQFGPLRARVAGGEDREGGGDGPVVVLCHGFGAPGDDLAQLWRVLDVAPNTRFVFPEAPLELDGGAFGGRAWWMIDTIALERAVASGEMRDLSRTDPDGLDSARVQLLAMLDAVEDELSVSGERVVLGGFSQGAMLACDVALSTERPLAGLVLLSGTLLAAERWIPLMPRRRELPVFQSHGRQDPLLPFVLAERLHDELERAGVSITWYPFNGYHEISPGALEGVGHYLTALHAAS